MRPSWDDTWLDIAEVVSRRSSCTRRQVGAVIVSYDDRLVSSGYNGTPRGELNCDQGGCPRGKLSGPLPEDYITYECWALHAEANALLRLHERSLGFRLYCTHKPCSQCQNLIMGSGITKVYWLDHSMPLGYGTWDVYLGRLKA